VGVRAIEVHYVTTTNFFVGVGTPGPPPSTGPVPKNAVQFSSNLKVIQY